MFLQRCQGGGEVLLHGRVLNHAHIGPGVVAAEGAGQGVLKHPGIHLGVDFKLEIGNTLVQRVHDRR